MRNRRIINNTCVYKLKQINVDIALVEFVIASGNIYEMYVR